VTPTCPSPIQFTVIDLPLATGSAQTLTWQFSHPQGRIQPADLARITLPADLDLNQGVVLYGSGPAWLYGYLAQCCLAAPWLGCYHARDHQVVVVQSQVPQPQVGDSLTVRLNADPCPAILIGGPPNSGKSVLSNALRLGLRHRQPQQGWFLHRASWDGEGNWAYEAPALDLVNTLVRRNEHRIHEDPKTATLIPDYFRYQAQSVANLRQVVGGLLVDVGGMPQPEKHPLLAQCTHYIVISRLPEEVDRWHRFCQPWLQPLAVVHSVLPPQLEVQQTTPWLELVAGPWLRGKTTTVPDCLLTHIISALAPHPAAPA
jgi:CRISPR-associated protein Csx3